MRRWLSRFRQPGSVIDPYDPSTAWLGLLCSYLATLAFILIVGALVAALWS
jgi:hypothetical protein